MLIPLGESYINTDHIVTIMDSRMNNRTAVVQFVAGPTLTLHGANRHEVMEIIQKEMGKARA